MERDLCFFPHDRLIVVKMGMIVDRGDVQSVPSLRLNYVDFSYYSVSL
jgi:hypothetical protein